ncbi:maleylpyruvate isomerase family mycothiol-dependent enzyme [Frankia sp. Cppng1_Ct_nod]|uniref:maleylpyruvate isomerase family mycothiol-dependent enzyme n=1 Tax=Frankia sp. Cppng1_Ct_nod TaxID=2897162 RepID=UPI001040E891|nr:maleylpyruvate isomerase family mycothiol-dependent enzyme [Frankia sp. Cppng1_Ct_nod]
MSVRKAGAGPGDLAHPHPSVHLSEARSEARYGQHVDDILGAYLLGAVDPDETIIVETHLGRCVQCSATAETLGLGLVGLAGAPPATAAFPDDPARGAELTGAARMEAVMAAALARRPAMPPVSEIADVYVTQVAAIDRLLAELTADDWALPVVNGWNPRELVAHLAATDGLVAAGIGLPVDPPVRSTDLDERTAAVHAYQHDWSAERTWRAWHDAASRIAERLGQAARSGAAPPATADKRTARLYDYLTARAFETWIHGRDIAERVGLAMPLPPADHLHRMADSAIRMLNPLLRAALPPTSTDVTVLVTLSGAGGGRWHVTPEVARTIPGTGDDPAVSARLSADIVDFCLLVADRTRAQDVNVRLAGDTDVGWAMLGLAPSLSGA